MFDVLNSEWDNAASGSAPLADGLHPGVIKDAGSDSDDKYGNSIWWKVYFPSINADKLIRFKVTPAAAGLIKGQFKVLGAVPPAPRHIPEYLANSIGLEVIVRKKTSSDGKYENFYFNSVTGRQESISTQQSPAEKFDLPF